MSIRKPLTVYRASAGSGKTFTLASEYIKLLIERPDAYKNILAVTFTNKATEEMKHRILSQLYGIWQSLPESESYLDKVLADLPNMSPMAARENAGLALRHLLHDYSYFRVETIDTFFQSVMRNLARELELTPNLRVGLNDKEVEAEAVDEMIEGLEAGDEVRRHLMNYVGEKIADDKSWNVIGGIKKFGETIFRDFYREESKQLVARMEEKGFFDEFIKTLRRQQRDAEKEMLDYARQFFKTLDDNGLRVDDFANKEKGICSFFRKIEDGNFTEKILEPANVQNCAQSAEKWVTKSNPRRTDILALAESTLMPLLNTVIQARARCWKDYQSARLTLSHLYQLRLLGNIEQKVRELNELHERFLLSDTQFMLSKMIDESDSPFVFEKIGSHLNHIMIDEFQDTGTKQWRNFKVLLSDCMSQSGAQNLIVGDVKQSIYRWRSGDWRILNGIRGEFANSDAMLDIRTLDTNYRSARHVVEFNNAFFRSAVDLECGDYPAGYESAADELRNAYSDVEQKVPEGRRAEGHIDITLFAAKTPDYKNVVMGRLADTIAALLAEGVLMSRIAILARYNNQIAEIADYFSENMPEVKIVSDEAFRLDSSSAVNILVCAMKLLVTPGDQLTKAALVSLYRAEVLHRHEPLSQLMLDKSLSLDDLLPAAFRDIATATAHLSLSDLAEWIYRTLDLQTIPGQTEYVCAFFDCLTKFADENTPTLRAFLQAWEETIHKKTIQDASVDGVRIISIHKSKGLEFDHVLLPFCEWKLEKTSGNTIWCRVDEPPYNQLPLIPVDFSEAALRGTVFEQAYLDEHLQNVVDNLNLLYVAFTRARMSLHVIGQRATRTSRSFLIENTLSILETALDGAKLEDDDDGKGAMRFTYGTPQLAGKERAAANIEAEPTDNPNVFMQKSKSVPVSIGVFDSKVEFRQSNAARRFMDEEESSEYISMGTLFHKVFSTIHTSDDIDAALAQLQSEGLLVDGRSVEQMQTMLRRRLTNPRVADWFSPRWRVFNECTIIYKDASGGVCECRPDRVITDGKETIVIDFKFGEPRPGYREQVEGYKAHLSAMGMPGVKGVLWYVYSNKIEEVN